MQLNTGLSENTMENAIVVGYPNTRGDVGRYSLADQRDYFGRFYCGSSHIFELALNHALGGDLLSFQDQCSSIFENHFQVLLDENTIALEENSLGLPSYQSERREFYRRTFDLYRYAKTSLAVLGKELPFTHVKRLSSNHRFDSGTFLLT